MALGSETTVRAPVLMFDSAPKTEVSRSDQWDILVIAILLHA